MEALALCLLAVFFFCFSSSAWGQVTTLRPGDFVVVDYDGVAVYQVDPATGDQTLISSGQFFVAPSTVAFSSNGDLLIVDQYTPGIIKVDPATGAQTVLFYGGAAHGSPLVTPIGLVFDPNGDIIVVGVGYGGLGQVVRIRPDGAQSVITSSLGGLWGVAWDNDHTLLVTQFFGVAQVLRVDPVTGHVTIAVSDARFAQPRGVLVQPNGDIFMADYLAFGSGAIFKISGGTTTVFSSGGIMNGPHGIRFDPNGNILVANYFGGNVIKIDGTNGEQSLVSPQSGANLFWTPHDVEVVPGGYRVAIDIKPGGSPNSINLKSEGVVPVAILGSQSFNVVDVDVSTVSFAGALPEKFAYEDVNSDGLIDLVFHFRTQHLQLTSSSTEAILIGKLRDGRSITGTDSVRIVPSGPKS